jgi:DNA-directed RNA polymerase subunit beta'
MRTFHTGGVAGAADITTGLPRVEELFEARNPKGEAIISEIDGSVEIFDEGERRIVRVVSSETFVDEYDLPARSELLVKEGEHVAEGTPLAAGPAPKGASEDTPVPQVLARISGVVRQSGKSKLQVIYEEREEREYPVPAASRILVSNGEFIYAGTQITDGAKNPQHILSIQGREAVQRYMVDEVQKIYQSQGVPINDKHIEIITRQMLRRVKVDHPGDSGLLPGDLVERREFEQVNNRIVAEGGEPATAQPVLLGVTKASLNTDSWLAAASFVETTRVLTNAAVEGKVDHLLGLKENVIIGKLIPARVEIEVPRRETYAELDLPESLLIEDDEELMHMLGGQGGDVAVALAEPQTKTDVSQVIIDEDDDEERIG